MGLPASNQAISRLARLAELLENDAVDMGFLGPNEGQRVISRHVLESAALMPHLIRDGPIVDVGSGAGLPGLVLGALGERVVLIETQAKRSAFLRRVADELDIDADVRQARAEDEGRGALRESAATAVARALAAPTVALELCLPLVRIGGCVLLPTSPADGGGDAHPRERRRTGPRGRAPHEPGDPDPPSAEETPALADPRASRAEPGQRIGDRDHVASSRPGRPPRAVPQVLVDVAGQLGGGDVRWTELSVPGVGEPRWVMMVDKRRPTPDRFPRRPGVPKRRPLGGDVASVK